MRAVNLVPPESRSGQFNGGKSGGAVYGVLGGLVVLLVMLSLLALAHKDRAKAQQELTSVQQSTQSFEQVASQYASYSQAAKDVNDRIALVKSIADARFDWAGALRDMARLIPMQTQINNLSASVTPDVSVGSDGSQMRSQLPVPAITISGCTVNQSSVADLVTRLQAARRVENVTLESSSTEGNIEDSSSSSAGSGDSGSSGASGGGSDNGSSSDTCSLAKPNYDFTVTVFYAQGNSAKSDAVGSTTPATGGSATTVASTTPASTTPSSGN